MNPRKLHVALGAIALGLSACADGAASAPANEAAITGGAIDTTSYPEVGYLVFRLDSGPHTGEIFRPDCGATLIAPNVVLTAAHCVERKLVGSQGRTVVAVGFGDGLTGPTYPVVGTWEDWVNPEFATDVPWQTGQQMLDTRHDIAVIELAQDVPGLRPLALATERPRIGAIGMLIGYGKVVAGPDDERDELGMRPDHRDRYPGLRKSLDMKVLSARDQVEAFSVATGGRPRGDSCHADSGGPLILEGGVVAGTVVMSTDDVGETPVEGTGCDPEAGTMFTNVLFGENPNFLRRRLAAIAARRAAAGRGDAR